MDKPDFFGPYQISNDIVYVVHTYRGYPMGSLELREIAHGKMKQLSEELAKWEELDNLNQERLNG
jgi:hypothetical protein